MKKISVAETILAVLWHIQQAPINSIIKHKYFKIFCAEKSKSTCRSSIWRLCNNNLINRIDDINDLNIFSLTENGSKTALNAFIKAEMYLYNDEKQEWDGAWRMIFFDIPESKRKYRDMLRKILKLTGFKEFQKSTWIYPFPVPGFLKKLLFNSEIKPHIRFATTNSIEDDSDLRKAFNVTFKTKPDRIVKMF